MLAKILVLGKGVPYDFVPEGEVKKLTGQKVDYIMLEGANTAEGAAGFSAAAQSMSLLEAAKLKHVPGTYTASFAMKVGKNGPQLKLVSVDESTSRPFEFPKA